MNAREPAFVAPFLQKTQSNRGSENSKMKVYENTYKMIPNAVFPHSKIKEIVQKILNEELTNKCYDAESCRELTSYISDIIKTEVKQLHFDRYKIVCIVYIGQRGNQQIKVGSRCLWDDKLDTYTSVEYQNISLFAIATVYGIYFE